MRPDLRSPMGGWQGATGKFAFFDYSAGSFWDRLAEGYAGPHDWLNRPLWYDAQGNIAAGMLKTAQQLGEIVNYLNVLLATPVALGALLTPGMTHAVQQGAKQPQRAGR